MRLLCHNTEEMAANENMTVTLADGGRLVIPAPYRRALGLKPGDQVVLRLEGNELRLRSRAEALRQARAIVRKHIKPPVSLVDELIAERRKESARE